MEMIFTWAGSVCKVVIVTLKGMFTDPFFLLISASGAGFINIFMHRTDLTIDLVFATAMSFVVMTILGFFKHLKEGEPDGKEFLIKTLSQLAIAFSVILLGYIGAIVLNVAFKFATQSVGDVSVIPSMSLYFIFSGYAIIISYYFIRCCDFIDIIFPNLLPKWFAESFRQFRKTGKYKDLLTTPNKEYEDERDDV